MKRMHIAAMTLALAGVSTAGGIAATDPGSPRGERTAVSESMVYVPRRVVAPRQDILESAAAKRAAAAARAAAQQAAQRAAAAKAAAAKVATARAAAARAAAQRLAAQRAAATRVAAARAAGARASRSTARAPIAGGNPRAIAAGMLSGFGWSAGQFGCLDSLWSRESGWRVNAANPSGAYGIPQALPGSKMAAYGSDWATNPATQITWGLHYIAARYGSPCSAWAHSQSNGWY